MVWNAGLGHGHPAHAQGARRGGRTRPAGHAQRGLPGQAARRRAAGRGDAARAREDVLLPVGRGGERERGQDRAARDGPEQDRRAHAQLPRRDAGDAVAVGRSAPRTVRARAARRRAHGRSVLLPLSVRQGAVDVRPRVRPGSGDRAAARGPGDGRRRDHGGRRRRQRRVHAARRLLEEDPRDLRSPRRAADRRRGAVGLRPDRPLVRRRPRRRHARSADDGQGDHGRLRAGRRRHRHRPDRPALRRAGAGVRPDQLRPPAGLRGDRRRHRELSRRGAGRARGGGGRAPRARVFDDFARQRPYLGEVRGVGLLWAFEFCLPGTRNPLPVGYHG